MSEEEEEVLQPQLKTHSSLGARATTKLSLSLSPPRAMLLLLLQISLLLFFHRPLLSLQALSRTGTEEDGGGGRRRDDGAFLPKKLSFSFYLTGLLRT